MHVLKGLLHLKLCRCIFEELQRCERGCVRFKLVAARGVLRVLSRDAGLPEHGVATREACARVAGTYAGIAMAGASSSMPQVGKGRGAAGPLPCFGIARVPSPTPQQMRDIVS